MTTIIDELLVALGYDYDSTEVKEFKKELDDVIDLTKQLVTVSVAAASALTAMAIASSKASDSQAKLSREIGEDVENIDALQFALRRAGGEAEGITNSLQQLAIRASEAFRGMGSGVEAFGLLGIAVSDAEGNLKTTGELLLEISDKFQGLSNSQQIELADKLGVRDAILLLQQGSEGIAQLTEEARLLGVTTQEDAILSEEFQDSLTDLWQITKQISRTISRFLLPLMEETVNVFTEWWKTNRQLIEQNLPEWIDKLTTAFKVLVSVVLAFIGIKLVTTLISLISLMRNLTLATLAMNAAMAILPVLITAAVTALILLIEDLMVFLRGGDSLIGDMLEKYPKLKSAFETVRDVILDAKDAIVEAHEAFSNFIEDSGIKSFIDRLGGIEAFLNGEAGRQLGEETREGIIDFFSRLGYQNFNNPINNQIPVAANGNTRNSTSIDTIEINVNGAGNPEEVANRVMDKFQQTSQDLNTVVEQ